MPSTLTRANRALAVFLGSSAARRITAAMSRTFSAKLFSPASEPRNRYSFFETLENRQLMSATYYVSPSGNDSSSGTSTSSAWKSIGKINSVHLGAGDKVLFQGGSTFSGSMHLYNDGGSSSDPVIIGSYGSGRATLSSGSSNGIWVLNSQGITIENLVIKGSPGNTGAQDGIRIESYNKGTASGFTVTGCDISGYAQAGIEVLADGTGEYTSNVTISNDNVYNNVVAGIQAYSAGSFGITNLTISNDLVYNNYGNSSDTVTGSGIELAGVNGAMVDHDSAYNNGADGNGAVGIWAYSSNNVTFEYDQSYDNHASKIDGDGFDFDSDTSNSVMQYNLAYNNDGGGFLLDQWKNDSLFTGNIVRFNVSESNCRKWNYGEVESWGRVLNSSFYNNVIYSTANSSKSNVAIRVHNSSIPGLYSDNVHFDNNVIETTDGEDLILIPSGETQGMKDVTFDGNVYWSNGSAMKIAVGSATYSSLSAFQSSGQEKFNGVDVGMFANPLFKAAGDATPTSGVFSLSSISAYDLQSSTPILNAGVNLSSALGIATPSTGSAKTVPGVDQTLAGGVSKSTSTAAAEATSVATPGTVGGVMSGWDIGSVAHKGANNAPTSSVSITSGGTSIGGTSDAFRYIFTTLTGNGQIVAQVSSFSTSASGMEAGVMIRNGTAANAAEVSLLLSPDKDADLTDRTTAGASTSTTTKADSGDEYVKLVREGTSFSSYISSNGSSWTLLGTDTVAMGSTVDIGMAVTSYSSSTTDTANFSKVAVTGLV